jgi:hypothetical protein
MMPPLRKVLLVTTMPPPLIVPLLVTLPLKVVLWTLTAVNALPAATPPGNGPLYTDILAPHGISG